MGTKKHYDGRPVTKCMSAKEFQESGLLQEVNRQFLHPRGLALAVTLPGEEDEDKEIQLGPIYDFRDDPEGVVYGDLSGKESKKKEANVRKMFEKHWMERVERFDFVIQPVGDKRGTE